MNRCCKLILVPRLGWLLTACASRSNGRKHLRLVVNSGLEGDTFKGAARENSAQFAVDLSVAEFPYANLFGKELVDVANHTGAYDLIMPDDPWIPRVAAADHSLRRGPFRFSLTAEQQTRLNAPEWVTLGIRPEEIRVSSEPRPDGDRATVYVTEMMGNETIVFLALGEEKLVARFGPDFHLDMEALVWVELNMTQAHFCEVTSGGRIN